MSTSSSQSCESVATLLDAFHDGELEPGERVSVASHLESCEACSSALQEISLVADSLRRLPELKSPRDFSLDVDKIIEKANKKKVLSFRRPYLIGSLSVACAVALLAVVMAWHGPQPALVADSVIKSGNHKEAAQSKDQSEKQELAAITAASQGSGNRSAADNRSIQKDLALLPSLTRRSQSVRKDEREREDATATDGRAGSRSASRSIGSSAPRSDDGEVDASAKGKLEPEVIAQRPGGDNDHLREGRASGVPQQELVAAYDPDQSNVITEELGITTNEDGLYAIKL